MLVLPKWGASRGISPPHARLPHSGPNANVRLGGTPTFPAALVRGCRRRPERHWAVTRALERRAPTFSRSSRRRRHPSTRAAGNVWGLSEADIGARLQVGEPSVRPQIFRVKPPTSGARASANDRRAEERRGSAWDRREGERWCRKIASRSAQVDHRRRLAYLATR